jgi:hypothetical protein
MVTALSKLPRGIDDRFDINCWKKVGIDLARRSLAKGGELVPRHGGNGYAFLKLYQRTQK